MYVNDRPWKERAWILRNALDVSKEIILLHGYVVKGASAYSFMRQLASYSLPLHLLNSSHRIGSSASVHVGSHTYSRE